MTIGELIEQLGGKLAQGDAEIVIAGVNSPANARRTSWYLPRMQAPPAKR